MTTGLFANGLNLNGFGARATAMGGAYVSLANDSTAVFWNPAGPGPAEEGDVRPGRRPPHPEEHLHPRPAQHGDDEEVLSGRPPGLLPADRGPDRRRRRRLHPVRARRGLGQPGARGRSCSSGLPSGSAVTPAVEAYDWGSFIGSITLAPSIAVKLTDMLYVGATVNINYGFFQTDQWGRDLVRSSPARRPMSSTSASRPSTSRAGATARPSASWSSRAT